MALARSLQGLHRIGLAGRCSREGVQGSVGIRDSRARCCRERGLDTYSHVLPAADAATAHTLADVILGGP